jgi:hypothetical protein
MVTVAWCPVLLLQGVPSTAGFTTGFLLGLKMF